MTIRTVGAWAGFLVAGATLTGCTGTGSNPGLASRGTAGVPSRISPTAPTAQTAAGTPANASPWNRQAATTATASTRTPATTTSPTGGPAMGSTPNTIAPAGGLTPPAPLAGAGTDATPAAGTTTSKLLPSSPSIVNLNAGTAVSASAVKPASLQVAAHQPRPNETTRTSMPAPAGAVVEEPAAVSPPPMPTTAEMAMPVPPPPMPEMAPPPVTLPQALPQVKARSQDG